jgi:predicted PurR-regulated permease PerM
MFVAVLKQHLTVDVKKACEELKKLSVDDKNNFINALLELGFANDDLCDAQRELISEIAAGLDVGETQLAEYINASAAARERKQRIIKSGAGIIVALIVIAIFILAATFLKSVLFGLILAYIFLPLEKFYERKFATSRLFLKIFSIFGAIFSPFKKLASLLRRNKERPELSDEQKEKNRVAALINKATTATVSTVVVVSLVLLVLLTTVSFSYISGVGKSIRNWVKEHTVEVVDKSKDGTVDETVVGDKDVPVGVATDADESGAVPAKDAAKGKPNFIAEWAKKLEELKPKLEKIPAVAWGVEQVSQYINNPDNQKALLGMVLKKTGGLFSFTAGFLSHVFSLLLDILMTIFFFSLILNKMAQFCFERQNRDQQSEYLVKAVFNSKWLPHTNEETLSEAHNILNDVILKLRTWLKGYLSIIIIESIIYITLFTILGVPYSLLLGFLAGCTVLLPYIGPFASAALTCLVCLAVGPPDCMVTLVLVIICYLIMNGVVEQLFLYPSLVGEALGLTTLETIIVVLLGGIFAGLVGMIFAVPAASVLKYLIPKIYGCWQKA